MTLGAYDHQDLPFEKLVEEFQPERDLSHTPLFQVMFAFQNAPTEELELRGMNVSRLWLPTGTAKFDLTLSIGQTEGALAGELEYSTDLFNTATVRQMLGHLRTLLDGIVADPKQRLSELPLLTEAERHQLLVQWNDTKADFPSDTCIHELFQQQVELTPDAIAVVFDDQRLTYSELNRRANQLGHYLRGVGVGPEVPVGLCVERSLEMVVGLLGILKAGGAYLPLDPDYPKPRLAFMLEDAQTPVLLTQQRLVGDLPGLAAQVLCLDTDWEAIARESEGNPVSEATAEDLAYVIYTSGSTGKPKGVTICHGNVVRLFQATHAWFAFDECDVWTLFHSYAFDFSVWEIWGALLYGGRLVVAPFWVSRSPDAFYKLLWTEQVTVLNQTPSAFGQLMRAEEHDSTLAKELALRLVIFGGEALEVGSLRPWFERHGSECPKLVNMYGITETTVHVTYCPMTEGDVGTAQGSPIRRPIPDLQAYLLDRSLQLVPVGVAGELHIGGDGLARGYLGRPELTAEKFIANPFSQQAGARLYRTGDLARYLPDGNIEFLGRIDHQVKLRGYRIELAEIEAALAEHPAVTEAVVVLREDDPGRKRLVAYVVTEGGRGTGGSALTGGELRGWVREKLPDYMVPSTFVMVGELPLTANGKVDRQALLASDSAGIKLNPDFIAPGDELELTLAQIWEEILDIRPIGIRDNFWDLGGHSLLALRLLGQIRKIYSRELPLSTLFQEPTVEHLASVLRQQEGISTLSSFVAIQPYGSKPPFFVGGSSPRYTSLARYLGVDQPFYRLDVYALQEQCLETGREPYTQIEAIAAHFIKKIRAVQPVGPYFLGGGCEGGYVVFEIAQQLQKQGQHVAMLVLWEVPLSPFSRKKPFYHFFYLAHHIRSLFQQGPKKLVTKLLERARAANRYHPDAGSVEASRLQWIQSAISLALQNNAPQVYPGRIILFRAQEQPPGLYDPTVGWNELVTGGTEIHVLPGNHTTYAETHFLDFAERLKTCLDKAQTVNSGVNTP